MRFVKWVLKSFLGMIDAWAGVGSNTTVSEALLETIPLVVVAGLFYIILFSMDRKTKLTSKMSFLVSLLLTIAIVAIIFLGAIIIEAIIY